MKVSLIQRKTRNINWQNLSNLGCRSTYMPECPDHSDVFVCLDRACKRDSKYFQCKDGKYCIYENLVCDGYAQCEDASGKI